MDGGGVGREIKWHVGVLAEMRRVITPVRTNDATSWLLTGMQLPVNGWGWDDKKWNCRCDAFRETIYRLNCIKERKQLLLEDSTLFFFSVL